MFPDAADATLSHALATSNGDVSAAVEQLLPANEQVRTDAELARALQAADAGGVPRGGDGGGDGGGEMPDLASLAQPVMEGLAAAGSAAKAAVEYIATEISNAATGGSARPQQATSSPRRLDDDSSVLTGGGGRAATASGVTLRSNRGSGRSNHSGFGGKED